MVARSFSSEIHPIFVPNSREKASVFARDFGQELFFSDSEWTFSMVVFGIVVVVVVAVVTGRRVKKKMHLFTLWPTILQWKQAFFILSSMMAGETHFAFFFSANFLAIFAAELVTVSSQSITSSVVESTIIKFPVTLNYRRLRPILHP